MRLRIGGAVRPNNECVAAISYKPIYDVSRLVVSMMERWDITGVIVNDPATQQQMTAEMLALQQAFSQQNVDLVFLEDDTEAPTALALYRSQCLQGPWIVDSSLPNQADDVYATGMSYRVTFEAQRYVGTGSTLLQFQEQIVEDPGGEERVYVGGAVNYPERQIGMQHRTYKYKQIGSAEGLFAYPNIPPPIWPFALVRDEPRVTLQNPKNLGKIDTGFVVSWEYEFEWHQKLYGIPHRRFQ